MEKFGQFGEDGHGQDRNHWRLKIKEEIANIDLSRDWPLKCHV